MNKRKIFSCVTACAFVFAVVACGNDAMTAGANEPVQASASAAATFRVETVAEGLQVPWSIAWSSPERMLVTERPGRVRVVLRGALESKPLFIVPDIEPSGENGLMGMALHPRYADNKFVYLAYAYRADGRRVKVVRYRDAGDTLADARVVVENIPAQKYHAGTRLRFGTDGKLYVTTGDGTQGKLAQRLDSLAGKTLRLNDDGSIPPDNPFVGQANARGEIWSYGHRNSQGLDFHPTENFMVQTEHGPSFPLDGWRSGGDEINIVERGKNYGWNVISFDKTRAGMESPLVMYKDAIAPASGMFYRASGGANYLPQFVNNYFFGALKGEALMRLVFDGRRVVAQERLLGNSYGRIREVAQAPDGAIYFTTSNRDGRGSPDKSDDRIMRIVKK
jgi:glucose/arabinose dehydrogenase